MRDESYGGASRKLERTKTPGIYKRGGRYVIVYRDPSGKQRKRSAATLKAARDLKAALTADIARGEYRTLSRVTFAEFAPEWIGSYAGRTSSGVREATLSGYRRALGLDEDGSPRDDLDGAVHFFGRRPLAEIEPRDVRRYVTEVAARGVSRDTVRLALAPVRALFADALEDGLIRSNPATGVRIPAPAETDVPDEERAKALTEDELAALLAKTPPAWRLLVRLLVETGLRIGEAIALQWGDVDLGRRRLAVRRRYYKGSFAPPKSRYGRREVPLSAALARELWQRGGKADDRELVVPGRRAGEPLDASTAFRAVKAAARAAGVGWAGPHTLRHTCATRLFRAGLNAKQVQVWLGHHSPAFTLATYVHLLADDLPEPAFFDELAPAGIDEELGETAAGDLERESVSDDAAEGAS